MGTTELTDPEQYAKLAADLWTLSVRLDNCRRFEGSDKSYWVNRYWHNQSWVAVEDLLKL